MAVPRAPPAPNRNTMDVVEPAFATSGRRPDYEIEEREAKRRRTILPREGMFDIPELRREREKNGPLPPGDINARLEAEKLMRRDPRYDFVEMVAGFSGVDPKRYFDLSAAEQTVTELVRSVQDAAVVARNSTSYTNELRRQAEQLEKRAKEAKEEFDEATQQARDMEAGRSNYQSATKVVEKEFGSVEYFQTKETTEKRATDALSSPFLSYQATDLQDLLTRSAVASHGPFGFTTEAFRRQIESLFDRTCANIPGDTDKVPEVRAGIPVTSRLALYLTALHVLVRTPFLYEQVLNRTEHASDSEYASNPALYLLDLEELERLVFGVQVKQTDPFPNYLDYNVITLGMYIKLRAMHRRSGSLLPKLVRPVIDQGGGGSRRRNNRSTVAGVSVVVNIDDDELERNQDGIANPDEALSPDDLESLRNTPLRAATDTTSVDVQQILLEVLKPVFDISFPFYFYEGNPLDPVLDFGGETEEVVFRRLFGVENPPDSAPSDKKERPIGSELTTLISVSIPLTTKKRGRPRTKTLAIAGHNSNQAEVTNATIGEHWNYFAGFLVFALGVFEHSAASKSTAQTVRALMLDGFFRAPALAEQIVQVVVPSEEQRRKYLSDLRDTRIKQQILPVFAQIVSAADRADPEALEVLKITSQDIELLRRYLTEDPGPDLEQIEKEVYELYQKKMGEDGSVLLPDNARSAVKQTKSNSVFDTFAKSDGLSRAIARTKARAQKEREEEKETIQQAKELRETVQQRTTESDQETRERLEQGLERGNVVDPRSLTSTLNTGVVTLTPVFTSALSRAKKLVNQYVKGLAHVSQEFLQNDPRVRDTFAELVANQINGIQISHPDVYRKVKDKEYQMSREQSLINDLRLAVSRSRSSTQGYVNARIARAPRALWQPVVTQTSGTYSANMWSGTGRGYYR